MGFSDFMKNVKNETGDAIEVTKLKAKISKEKTAIKDAYGEIGEMLYKKYKQTGEIPAGCEEFMTKIDACRASIHGYNQQIDAIKMN